MHFVLLLFWRGWVELHYFGEGGRSFIILERVGGVSLFN